MTDSADAFDESTTQLLKGLAQAALAVSGPDVSSGNSEVDYKTLWLSQLGLQDAPGEYSSSAIRALNIALQGGALADCLSHVFIAGYQGAIRHVLPSTPAAQWFSLLVSEDQQDSEANPPTLLQYNSMGAKVFGTKSWVACSATVDGLVVSAKSESADVQWFWCAAQNPAIRLTHRQAPSFLPDVSQGFARFDHLQVPKRQLLEAAPFTNFMHAESLYVGLALVGYLWRHWQQQEDIQAALASKQEPARSFAVAVAAGLADAVLIAQSPKGDLPLALLQSWQLRVAALIDQFEEHWLGTAEAPKANALASSTWAGHWWRDHRLTFMYAPLIRSQFAKATLSKLTADPT